MTERCFTLLFVAAISGCSLTNNLDDFTGGKPDAGVSDAEVEKDGGGSDVQAEANVCTAGGSPCQSAAACCSGVCLSDDTCASCKPLGAGCKTDAECCAGQGNACYDGTCSACAANDAACKIGSECCSGVCALGKCRACGVTGDACDTGTPCCEGYTCESGKCTGTACDVCLAQNCADETAQCDANAECAAIEQCQAYCVGVGGDPDGCLQNCMGSHPNGTDAFNKLLACALGNCSADCVQ